MVRKVPLFIGRPIRFSVTSRLTGLNSVNLIYDFYAS